ncbi:MAG: hypothetical protein JWN38_902 [Candidatus Saccharibacteria bacterium]|nr:hypothetical protein [Candidatus Saccharibacteria bacterium]
MYGFIFHALRKLGFKKTAVRLAIFCESLYNHNNLKNLSYVAYHYLSSANTGFDSCAYCWHPLTEPHETCEAELQAQQDDEDAEHERQFKDHEALLDLMSEFCRHGSCYSLDVNYYDGCCDEHTTLHDDYDDRYDGDDEDDYVSSSTIYSRAYNHFGNAEQAREAAELYPGDFM